MLVLCDKSDFFMFSFVWMLYLPSNTTPKILYASLGTENLRICRSTTGFNEFKLSCETLISRMIKQGDALKSMKRILPLIYGTNYDVFAKFADTYENFINFLFPQYNI